MAEVGESGAGRWRTYGIVDLDHSAELRDHESGATSAARAEKQRDAILEFWTLARVGPKKRHLYDTQQMPRIRLGACRCVTTGC